MKLCLGQTYDHFIVDNNNLDLFLHLKTCEQEQAADGQTTTTTTVKLSTRQESDRVTRWKLCSI